MSDSLDIAYFRNAKQGDVILFGSYPQVAHDAVPTPIQWRVLENTGTELFILSTYLLDCRQYHSTFTDVTWRDCDLRESLNDVFYDMAFSHDEKVIIQTTLCTDNGEHSPDTEDKVFLLSEAEVTRLTDTLGKDFLKARGTEFAKIEKADGCHLYVMDKNVEADYISENGKMYGCSWWWLRDQGRLKDKGNDPSRAVFVGTRASIRHYAHVDLKGYGVRPALKMDL